MGDLHRGSGTSGGRKRGFDLEVYITTRERCAGLKYRGNRNDGGLHNINKEGVEPEWEVAHTSLVYITNVCGGRKTREKRMYRYQKSLHNI